MFQKISNNNLTLPKNKLSIVERKNKTLYGLTRKELEDLPTYMYYLLYNMSDSKKQNKKYQEALYYANEKHNMNHLVSFEATDEDFAKWLTTCENSESYLEENMANLFSSLYNKKHKITDEQFNTIKQEIEFSLENRTIEIKTLDGFFKIQNKNGQIERTVNSFSNEDVYNSAYFITWQALRGLLLFNSLSSYNNITKDEIKHLTYGFINSLITDDYTVWDEFITKLPQLWH